MKIKWLYKGKAIGRLIVYASADSYIIEVRNTRNQPCTFVVPQMSLGKKECGQLTKAFEMLLHHAEQISEFPVRGSGGGRLKPAKMDDTVYVWVNANYLVIFENGKAEFPAISCEAPVFRRISKAAGLIFDLEPEKKVPLWKRWNLFTRERQ